MMDEAAVVICAYTIDRWDDLRTAVASVQAQNHPAREIILVIDHNEDLLRVAECEFTDITVVANKGVRGLSGGRMTGAELATAPVIVYLDDDAIAAPDWLGNLLAVYEDHRVLGAGGHIEPLWRVPRPKWFPAEFNWVIGCTYKGMPVYNGQVRNPIGASLSVRADVLRQAGGFATKLGRRYGGGAILGVVAESCEETEFCIRASRRHPGGVWMHCDNARVMHVVTPQRATWHYFLRRCVMEGTAKAVLTGLTGSGDGLGSERTYTLSLVKSVWRYLLAGNFAKAGAVCVGFSVTAAAYARARVVRALVSQKVNTPEIRPNTAL
jgi:glycosyltransferase involved in cell wall biosynthesis